MKKDNNKKEIYTKESTKTNEHIHIDKNEHNHVDKNITSFEIVLNIFAIILFVFMQFFADKMFFTNQVVLLIYIAIYILIGYEIFLNAIKKFLTKDMFDENFLMTIATFGAMCIGEYQEAIAVLLLYKIGEFLQDLAVENSRKKISEALEVRCEYANLLKENNTIKVKPEEVKVDDIIIVKNGEKFPLDGIISAGKTLIDTSILTGESMPQEVKINDFVYSGSINLGSVVEVKVKNIYDKSAVYKIVKLIENASSRKSKSEKFVSKFAKVYTPIVTFLAILIIVTFPILFNISFNESLKRAFSFLVVSCPCALVISIPLGFFIGIGACSKKGILVKGSNYLEKLSKTKKVVFDKTGTLTNGNFTISNIISKNKYISKDELLRYVVLCESYSNHYLAKSIINNYNKNIDLLAVKKHEEIPGMGVIATIDEKEVLVGSNKLLEKYNIKSDIKEISNTIVHVAIDNEYAGYVELEDTLKDEAQETISKLKKLGVSETYILTGDNKEISEKIRSKLKIDKAYYKLLPDEKLKEFENIKYNSLSKDVVVYVGDGVNDGPVIARADVGIAMGKGADLAIDTADVVLLNNKLNKLCDAIQIAQKTKFIIIENITLILVIKSIFLIFSGFGITSMWQAVFADVGVSIIAILNCFRIKTK